MSIPIIRTNYNAINQSSDDGEIDVYGHGTKVAGVIVDNTSDNVKIRSYRVTDDKGYSSKSNTVAAIYKAISDKADVINISLNGGTSFAAPFVSAAVALIKTEFPDAEPEEIDQLIKDCGRTSEFPEVNYAPYQNLAEILEPDMPSSLDPLSPQEHIFNESYNPIFNYDSGVYDDAVELQIQTGCDEETEIYYTVYDYNGEAFLQEETLYNGANGVVLDRPCCVVAKAYGQVYKGKSTAYYFIGDPTHHTFEIDDEGMITAFPARIV